ncbi:hypothetical protein BCY86_02090 [Pajaroellobacter abortibovis]|uniref:O-antigen ligase-related domain-containing protein n=2 Tax=Pajaroellobacter abortibovis TaxID=1882918 RepID=A0A1L6MVP7_9BACT|nr:hypothetical protein BCY86_02090 [Pajaroellobacter abortibovis]
MPLFFLQNRKPLHWLLTILIIGSSLAIGSLHTLTLCFFSLLAIGILFFASWNHPFFLNQRGKIIVTVSLGLTVFTCIQIIPLPISWIHFLAPINARIWENSLTPLHEAGPLVSPLSLSPYETRVQALRGFIYLTTFLICFQLGQHKKDQKILQWILILSVACIILCSLVHAWIGTDKVFGIYQPRAGSVGRHTGPLLNSNHLAGYINIGICILFGRILQKEYLFVTIPLFFSFFSMQLWVASRGGILAMIAGLSCILVRSKKIPFLTKKRHRLWAIGLLLTITSFSLGVLASQEEAWSELIDSDISKLTLTLYAIKATSLFPFFGMGRGAFETVFPFHLPVHPSISFTHPENWIAQWATEWGWLVSILAILLFTYALYPVRTSKNSLETLGPWGALLTTALHNLVDFNMEVPAIGIALSTCMGCVVGTLDKDQINQTVPRLFYHRIKMGAVCVMGLGLLRLAYQTIGKDLFWDRQHAYEIILHTPFDQATFHSFMRSAMLRHPADPYLPSLGAIRASFTHDESPLPWANRTLERQPHHGQIHAIIARELEKRNRRQSRFEYRLALSQDSSISPLVLQRVPLLIASYQDALEMIPAVSTVHFPFLLQLTDKLQAYLPSTASQLDYLIPEYDSHIAQIFTKKIQNILFDLRHPSLSPWCKEQQSCIQQALALVKKLQQLESYTCHGLILETEVKIIAHEGASAIESLLRLAAQQKDSLICLTEAAHIAEREQEQELLLKSLSTIMTISCALTSDSLYSRQNAVLFVAAAYIKQNNSYQALATYRQGKECIPHNPTILSQLASLASALGLHHEALNAFLELEQLQPNESKWNTLIESEKAFLTTEILTH